MVAAAARHAPRGGARAPQGAGAAEPRSGGAAFPGLLCTLTMRTHERDTPRGRSAALREAGPAACSARHGAPRPGAGPGTARVAASTKGTRAV